MGNFELLFKFRLYNHEVEPPSSTIYRSIQTMVGAYNMIETVGTQDTMLINLSGLGYKYAGISITRTVAEGGVVWRHAGYILRADTVVNILEKVYRRDILQIKTWRHGEI